MRSASRWQTAGVDIDEGLVEAVLVASRALVAIAAVSIEDAPVEVTLGQYRALVVLSSVAPLRMAQLGEACGLSPSSTTRMVERLERKGLVHRERSTTSRRSIDLDLTDAGRELVEVVMERRRVELRRVLAEVSPSKRDAVRRAFETFARASGEPSSLLLAAP